MTTHPAATAEAESAWLVSIDNGSGAFRWKRSGDDVIAEWVGILGAKIAPDGHIEWSPAGGADPTVVEKTRRTGGMAFIRALSGLPSLHGSAVSAAGSALVCLGESGAGKSTAAAELCEREGFALLSDDVVALEPRGREWWVPPTDTWHWLIADSLRKEPVASRSPAGASARLRAVVSLRFDAIGTLPQVRRLEGAEVFKTLSSAVVRFESTTGGLLRELDVLSALAASTPVYELVRPPRCSSSETASLLSSLLVES